MELNKNRISNILEQLDEVAVEDLKLFLKHAEEQKEKFDRMELEWAYAMNENDTLNALCEFNSKGKKKLIHENNLLKNDKKYLVEQLKSISRICTPGQKHNPDLDKILEIVNESLEEVN